jgi:hypothetical protein
LDESNLPRALLTRIRLVSVASDAYFLEVEATFEDSRGIEHKVRCEVLHSPRETRLRVPDEMVLHLCVVA